MYKKQDNFRGNRIKERRLKKVINNIVKDENLTDKIFELVKEQSEY